MLGDKLRRLVAQIGEVAAGGVVDPQTWRMFRTRVDAIADQVDQLELNVGPVAQQRIPRPRPPARPSATIVRLSEIRRSDPGEGCSQ